MLPFDLPPPLPYVCPAPPHLAGLPGIDAPALRLELVAQKASGAKDKDKNDAKISKEQVAFDKAVKTFEEALEKLPAKDKAEIAKLHNETDAWADKERASGKKADKLATFVGKVMTYLHQRLLVIEKTDPQLNKLKEEHRQLQKIFLQGDDVINAYLAWVKNKNDPIDQPAGSGNKPNKS
jgi:hypothetical protein